MGWLANEQWWLALGAWIALKSQTLVGYCVYMAESIEALKDGRTPEHHG